MTDIVNISAPSSLDCTAGETTQASFSLASTAPSSFHLGVRAVANKETPNRWLSLETESGRRVSPGEEITHTISVDVPDTAKPGEYGFHLLAFDLKEPGERFSQSDQVTVTVVAKPAPPEVIPPKLRRSWKVTILSTILALPMALLTILILGYGFIILVSALNTYVFTDDAIEFKKRQLFPLWFGATGLCALMVGITIRRGFSKVECLLAFILPALLALIVFIESSVVDFAAGIIFAYLAYRFWQKWRETAN